MDGVLVDSCVLLDLFTDDPHWGDWSADILARYRGANALCINAIIYAEISIGFANVKEMDAALSGLNVKVLEIPRDALFLAGKVFLRYRKNKGTKHSPLPDFFIGAHAFVADLQLITRDLRRYETYFPEIKLLHPGIS